MAIEDLVFNEYSEVFKDYKGYDVGGINTYLLPTKLKKYIIDKTTLLNNKIKDLKNFYSDDSIRKNNKDKSIAPVINELDNDFIYNLCLLHFILVSSYQNSEEKDKFYSTNVAMNIGRNMIRKYLFYLKCKYIYFKEASYSDWYTAKISTNKTLAKNVVYNDYIAHLGFRVIEILEYCNMVQNDLTTISYNERIYILSVDDKLSDLKSKSMLDFPLKLPMIVEPKKYDKENLGGYLLNNVKYSDELIIHKDIIKDKSLIKDDNVIYDMVNRISSTPYKINNELLDYILNNKHNLLMDPDEPSIYENIENKSKHQRAKHSSYISKINLQETILGIAEFFKNFTAIYFPVRMDSRGRMYCSSTYLNYQSSELAKALLLFSIPGIINKSNLTDVKYLEYYGVNCFGKDKISDSAKTKWIKDNTEDIINYNNGKLLNKAKDKLLFLAFCMEYSRYMNFLNNQNTFDFYTYLPIQLDATCNGFQHLALLSNEDTLFKELNLISDNDTPKDFYNFLVHKLGNMFDKNLEEEKVEQEKEKVEEKDGVNNTENT